MQNIHQQKILILDFGSQYTQLIARRIRELDVYCEIHPFDCGAEFIKTFAAQGIILSGGPASVTTDETPRIESIVFDLNVPVLGICYGMQAMMAQTGGAVEIASAHEYGHSDVSVLKASALWSGVENIFSAWMSHGDKVAQLGEGFEVIAKTDNAEMAAVAHREKPWFAVQFHPEVTHTDFGRKILSNFVHNICECSNLWTESNIIEDIIDSVRETVGQDKVILGLSGGVDSSVVAALLHKAIGSQLHCIFVNNGLLREGEAEQVQALFAEQFSMQLTTVDAREAFLSALKGIECPEEKRKTIGRVFIDVFDQAAQSIDGVTYLAQGTIYPDVIESAASKTGKATVIKSHHNVGGLPETMNLKLLEPLRELFKDEVRRIGVELGLPHDMVYRHPFPGPGLGVRVLGEVKPEYLNPLRQADKIFIEELEKADLYHKVSQAFAVFLPVRTVGVVGDARQYEYVVALRAVETIDFMTAKWAELPHAFLGKVSNRIINEVSGIARVVYDISGKPPATIEWE